MSNPCVCVFVDNVFVDLKPRVAWCVSSVGRFSSPGSPVQATLAELEAELAPVFFFPAAAAAATSGAPSPSPSPKISPFLHMPAETQRQALFAVYHMPALSPPTLKVRSPSPRYGCTPLLVWSSVGIRFLYNQLFFVRAA